MRWFSDTKSVPGYVLCVKATYKGERRAGILIFQNGSEKLAKLFAPRVFCHH